MDLREADLGMAEKPPKARDAYGLDPGPGADPQS
jgi:hypothetical protein